jgi:hypothetical protein
MQGRVDGWGLEVVPVLPSLVRHFVEGNTTQVNDVAVPMFHRHQLKHTRVLTFMLKNEQLPPPGKLIENRPEIFLPHLLVQ